MKYIAIILIAVFSWSTVLAIDGPTIRRYIESVSHVGYVDISNIESAINNILAKDSYLKSKYPDRKVKNVSLAIARAAMVSGVDWKILLTISYIESRMCLFKRGDRKANSYGNSLYSYWAVGCGQIHLKWWGAEITRAGLTQEALLDYQTNFIVTALIIRHYQDRFGFWEGVRRYNGSGYKSYQYLTKAKRIYANIAD